MATEDSRGLLSSTMLWSSSSGTAVSTAARWARPVTTMIRSAPAMGARRSQVSRRSEPPEPARSWRNFGAFALDSGQSREPMPPAGMIA